MRGVRSRGRTWDAAAPEPGTATEDAPVARRDRPYIYHNFTLSLCPTCLGTYVLVLAFAGVALFRLPGPITPSQEQLPRMLLWVLAPTLVPYGLLLVPGKMTPHAADKRNEERERRALPARLAISFASLGVA